MNKKISILRKIAFSLLPFIFVGGLILKQHTYTIMAILLFQCEILLMIYERSIKNDNKDE